MEIQSALNSGIQGFQNATEIANEAASNIARQTTEQNIVFNSAGFSPENFEQGQQANDSIIDQNTKSGDLASINKSLVDLRVAEFQAKASAEVIQTADDTLGTLIDVTA